MSTTHPTTVRNAFANLVNTTIGASGKMKLRIGGSTADSPSAAAATLSLSATAFGAPTAGVMSANTISSDTNAAGNASAVAAMTLETSGGSVVTHCAVAASGSDANLSNGLTINAGDTVSCSALTYTAPL